MPMREPEQDDNGASNANERTSLLVASFAPSAAQPNKHRPLANLEEVERSARRLMANENANHYLSDSDSINGLLAGFSDGENSVDSGSHLSMGGNDDEISKQKQVLTQKDLDYLGGRGRTARRTIDAIGDKLLEADDNLELEQRILRRSLCLHLPRSPSADADLMLTQSQRALQRRGSSIRKSVSYGGSVVVVAGGAQRATSHPEIEQGRSDDGDGGGGAKRRPKVRPLHGRYTIPSMVGLALVVLAVLAAVLFLGTLAVGPPRRPVGAYRIVEAQVGDAFWGYYDFYAGKDSMGSNGYVAYVSREVAEKEGIIEVVTEEVPRERMIEIRDNVDDANKWMAEDLAFLDQLDAEGKEEKEGALKQPKAKKQSKAIKLVDEQEAKKAEALAARDADNLSARLEPFNPDAPADATNSAPATETFVRLSSSPTPLGPRNSLRLHGRRHFNRGLFIIDLRHMPAGCATWPAFWMSDSEANWPLNGEIDIVEGVNYQATAKTALHATKTCVMDDVPPQSKTGSWDTAVGIPDRKTGKPDMTFRYAQNCFVYDPHQWINQGCVATDLKTEGRSLGTPLNANGGGVYALEWDPVNGHIRTWVFSPHGRVPSNLREALRTATETEKGRRVAPDTNAWGLPYGYFPIGEGTNCPSSHFRNMRLVINLAFCGSVAGTRYFMDCPEKKKLFDTCEEYVASDPEELEEAYWKIRGVYVYERDWERSWS